MDLAIYISLLILSVVLLVLLSLLAKSRTQKTAINDSDRDAQAQNIARLQNAQRGHQVQRAEGGPRRREPRRRMVRSRNDDDYEDDDDREMYYDDEDGISDIFDAIDQPDGKIGAKKMRKLQEKAEKRMERANIEQERLEKKQREAQREERRKRDDEKRKEEEALLAEEERLRKEEEERKEHEEYLKMKAMFTVDDEGENDLEADLTTGSLLQEFITYVKEMKVVILEDLAAHFKIKTQDAIDRIMSLQEMGELTGVVDDRGKFIYITIDELESVAKFIRQRGRVAISELAESSNRLINLNPENTDTTRRLYTSVAS